MSRACSSSPPAALLWVFLLSTKCSALHRPEGRSEHTNMQRLTWIITAWRQITHTDGSVAEGDLLFLASSLTGLVVYLLTGWGGTGCFLLGMGWGDVGFFQLCKSECFPKAGACVSSPVSALTNGLLRFFHRLPLVLPFQSPQSPQTSP